MRFLCIYFLFLLLVYIKQSNSTNNLLSDEYLGSTGKHLFHFVHVIITLYYCYVIYLYIK